VRKIILVLLTLLLFGCKPVIPEELTCEIDEECVPAACCHASSCVNENFEPDCSMRACTMDCKPDTMDCGQGRCICENSKCTAKIKN